MSDYNPNILFNFEECVDKECVDKECVAKKENKKLIKMAKTLNEFMSELLLGKYKDLKRP